MGSLKDYLYELRVLDWYKNLLILVGPFFGKKILDFYLYPKLFLGFIALSLISSSGYIVNDIKDAPFDIFHPKKSKRPIASGRISKLSGLTFSIFLLIFSLLISYMISAKFLFFSFLMFLNSLIYTFFLKSIEWLDITSISFNYVLRSLAGCEVVNVYASPWLIAGVFYVAMLFALAKRREELQILQEPHLHRKSLISYDLISIDQGISIFSSLIIVSYSLYTFIQPHSYLFIFTIPIVTLIVLRFVSSCKNEKEIGIIRKVLKDKVFLCSSFIWFLSVFFLIYFGFFTNLFT